MSIYRTETPVIRLLSVVFSPKQFFLHSSSYCCSHETERTVSVCWTCRIVTQMVLRIISLVVTVVATVVHIGYSEFTRRRNRKQQEEQHSQPSKSQQAYSFETCEVCKDPLCNPFGVLPGCFHIFHRRCIEEYLRNIKFICPICRRKLSPAEVSELLCSD